MNEHAGWRPTRTDSGSAASLEPTTPAVPRRNGDPTIRLLLGVSATLLGAFLIIPMIQLFRRGSIFGADWSEYLYSGPTYFGGAHPLFQYPYPAMPVAYLPLEHLLGHTSLIPVYVVEIISALILVACFYAGYLACRAYTGSEKAGVVGGLAFAGFPLLQAEIGWGGQAQLVAYLLGLLAVWVTLEKVLPRLSYRPAFAAGLLLGIGALSELYATVTIVLAFVLFLPLVLGRNLASRRGLAVLVAIVGPPAVAGGLLVRSIPAATNPAGGAKLVALWNFAPIYRQLWVDLTANNTVLGAIYIGTLVLYAVFRLLYRAPNRARAWLVPATGVAALLVGVALTPAVNSNRSVYPLVFPFAFAVAELSAGWPVAHAASLPQWRWHRSPRRVARVLPLLVVASLMITGAQLGADLQIYPDSLATYSFSAGEASELFFLSHEPGAILYDVAPIDHMFVDLWATGRPIYPGPAFEPYTVTSAPKQAAVELATALSFGENWVDDGRFVVTEAESAWGQPDPGILFFQNAHTFVGIEGNDFENNVSYSPGSNLSLRESADLFNASSTSTSAAGDGLVTAYAFEGYTVERVVSVSTSGTIYWNYTYEFSTTVPRGATLSITESSQIPTSGSVASESACCSEAALTQQFSEPPLPEMRQGYSILTSATNATVTAHYLPKNQYGVFDLVYAVVPSNATVRQFSLDIAIDPQGASRVTPTVHTEAAELAATGIEWVVLSRSSNPLILQRFMGDPRYSLYRSTPHFFVLAAG